MASIFKMYWNESSAYAYADRASYLIHNELLIAEEPIDDRVVVFCND